MVANDLFRIDIGENKIGYHLGAEDKESMTLDNVSGTTFEFYNNNEVIRDPTQNMQLKFILYNSIYNYSNMCITEKANSVIKQNLGVFFSVKGY